MGICEIIVIALGLYGIYYSHITNTIDKISTLVLKIIPSAGGVFLILYALNNANVLPIKNIVKEILTSILMKI